MNQFDVKRLERAGIHIIRDHSRDFAEFIATRNGVETVYKFRIQYQNKKGKIVAKDSSGRAVNCSEFTADELLQLCSGSPIVMSYVTTSDVERTHVVMLGKYVNQYGKDAVRPLPV